MSASDRAERVAQVVEAALNRDPSECRAFLDAACGGDSALRAEVESLLSYSRDAAGFIEEPAIHANAEAFAEEAGVLEIGQKIEQYRIVSLIGAGGMGEVYLAEDLSLGRKVALKLVKSAFGGSHLLRHFRQEERILAALTHPNIARLYGGAVMDNGVPYFVMEYVEGERLDDYCKRRELSLSDRLQLFRKICAAVGYAHQHLIIHRDLKPANIRVTPEGEPKLLDFGIAKLLDADAAAGEQTITLPGMMTPEYASPEQVRGETMTTASDIYSLGVILYELLSGEKPYRLTSNRPAELARAITDTSPPRPSTASSTTRSWKGEDRKALRGDLDNIVLMAMRKDPARRYTSVGLLAEDIRRHLEGRPVFARKDTFRYRTGKFVSRNKTAVAAAALVFLTLIAGIVATLRQAQIARRERDNAQVAQASAERLNQFLQSLLASANPDGMGKDVKVVQVLDSAAETLDRELADQPHLLAQAHLTIARAYARLRQAAPTEKHARRALEIAQTIHGNDHPATAEVMAFLGYALRVFRRFEEAEPLLRQAVAVQRRFPPPGKNDFPNLLVDLATVLGETGRAAEATPLVEEALERIRSASGDEGQEFADGLNALGNLRLALGDVAGAETAYRRGIDIHRQLTPPRFSSVNTLQNLIGILMQQRRLDEAESLLHEVEARCRAIVGEANPSYENIRGLFGYLHFLRGEYEAAVPGLQRVGEGLSRVYPREDPNVVAAKMLLGLALTRAGRPAEGEPYLREAYDVGRDGISESFGPVENRDLALGECLLAQGRHAEAEPLLVAAHERLQATAPASPAAEHARQLVQKLVN